MKKFKYSIESYLKLVKQRREVALREANKALAYRKQLERRYEKMDGQLKKALQKNSDFGRGLDDLRYVNDNNKYMELLKLQMRELSSEIAMAEESYQEKYRALLALQTEVRKYEIHKEQKKEEHKKKYKKLQQKITDELNSSKRGGRNAKSL